MFSLASISKTGVRQVISSTSFQSIRRMSILNKSFEHLLLSAPKRGVALIQLNRPKALNALCTPLIKELNEALQAFDEDDKIGAIVITGNEKAFAAGADIKEMLGYSVEDVLSNDFITPWSNISKIKKPLIGAVNGYALGGGCELAMALDILYAGEKAKFGQPEINLGIIPGAGGTQRLIRAIGKSRAMEYCLTGRMFGAQEACAWGLVSKVFAAEALLEETLKLAEEISSKGRIASASVKKCVNEANQLDLESGIRMERSVFYGLFGTADRTEGMSAFSEKRNPVWKHQKSEEKL